MSCCFQAPRQWCWCFRPPVLRFLLIFFSPHRPTHPKPGNLFDAKRTKRGWPKPYGFFLGFLTTLLPRISVYLSFALFCSFFVGEINWNWNWRFSSAHKKNEKHDDLLTARVGKIKAPRRRKVSREGVFYISRNYRFSAFSARKDTLPIPWYCQCWKRLSRNVTRNELLKLFTKRYKLKQTNKQKRLRKQTKQIDNASWIRR